MTKVVGDIAIAVEAETAGLIKGLNSGAVSVDDFGAKIQQMGRRVNAAERHTQSLLSEFGLTPVARAKVSAGRSTKTNPFAALETGI